MSNDQDFEKQVAEVLDAPCGHGLLHVAECCECLPKRVAAAALAASEFDESGGSLYAFLAALRGEGHRWASAPKVSL